jgi:hypothetical protein
MAGVERGAGSATLVCTLPSPTPQIAMSKLLRRLRRHRRSSERGISFGGPAAISLAVGMC